MSKFSLVVLVVAMACTDSSEPAPLPTLPPLPAAPATGCEQPIARQSEGQTHIQPPSSANYQTEPPTSGPHYETWAETGFHTDRLQDETAVHNLEHGHVVVWVNGLSASQTSALRAFTDTQQLWVVVSPRPTMGNVTLAFTAWGSVQRCGKPLLSPEVLAREFFDKFARKAPEEIPGTPLES